MATELDTKLIPKIKAILNRFGKLVTFVATTQSYNPATGVNTLTPTNKQWKITPPESAVAYGNETTVQVGDLRIYFAAEAITFTPVVGMTVVIDSVNWRIVALDTFYTGELVGLYSAQLRRQ